jgi:hypothetical protein
LYSPHLRFHFSPFLPLYHQLKSINDVETIIVDSTVGVTDSIGFSWCKHDNTVLIFEEHCLFSIILLRSLRSLSSYDLSASS